MIGRSSVVLVFALGYLELGCTDQVSVGGFFPRPNSEEPVGEEDAGILEGGTLTVPLAAVFQSHGGDIHVRHADLDESGNLYLVGTFANGADFGGQVAQTLGVERNGFAVSYSSAGEFRWLHTLPASGVSLANRVLVRGSELWVVGYFAGELTLGNTTLDAGSGQDLLVWHLDSTGAESSIAYRVGPQGNVQGRDVRAAEGGIVIAGVHLDTLELGDGPQGTESVGGDSGLVVGMSGGTSLMPTWSSSLSSDACSTQGVCSEATAFDELTPLVNGKLAAVGHFTGALSGNWSSASQGSSDALVVTYAEGEPQEHVVIGTPGEDKALAVTASEDGFVVIGSLGGELEAAGWGPEVWQDSGVQGEEDGFVAAFDGEASLTWAHRVGGAGNDSLRDVLVDDSGRVWVLGQSEVGFRFAETGFNSAEAPLYVLSFTPEGEPLGAWVFGSGTGAELASFAVMDSQVQVLGSFSGALTLGDLSLEAAGTQDLFHGAFEVPF